MAAAQGYTLENMAADGETSASLLEKLQKTDSEELAAAAAAELITITIGGNDLMGALYGYLAEKYVEDKPDVQDFDADDVREMLVAGNPDFLSFASQKISGFALSTQAHTALSGFTTNLNAIIGAIKQVNSDATILVATQYNPYYYLAKSMEGTPLFADIASKISSAFEAGVAALNYVVSDGTPAGYQVVDVYTAFNTAADSGTNPCNPSVSTVTFAIDLDFHPNQTGHDLIAEAINDKLPAKTYSLSVGGTTVTSQNANDVLATAPCAMTQPPKP